MAINRFEKFVNPGQIKVSPWELPFEELGLALASKQKSYDEKEAAIAELALPKSGNITQRYVDALGSKYNPRIEELESELYQTGEVNINTIKGLAKEIANDPMVDFVNRDREEFSALADAAIQTAEHPYGLQTYFDNDTNTYNQLDPSKFIAGASPGAAYGYMAPEDYVSKANTDVDAIVEPLIGTETGPGKLWKSPDGTWHIKKSQGDTYVGGVLTSTSTSTILTESKLKDYVKSQLTAKGDDGLSYMDRMYNNIGGTKEYRFWFEKYKKENNGQEPTVEQMTDLFVDSWLPSNYKKQTIDQKDAKIDDKKGNGSGTPSKDSGALFSAGIGQYGATYGEELQQTAKENNFNYAKMGIVESKQLESVLTNKITEKEKSYENVENLNFATKDDINNTIFKSIPDEEQSELAELQQFTEVIDENGDIQKVEREEDLNYFTSSYENGKVTFGLNPEVETFLIEEKGYTPTQISTLQSQLNGKASKAQEKLDVQKEQYEQIKSFNKMIAEQVGVQGLKFELANSEKAKAEIIEKEVALIGGAGAQGTPLSMMANTGENRAKFANAIKDILNQDLEGADGNFYLLMDENNNFVSVEKIKGDTQEEVLLQAQELFGGKGEPLRGKGYSIQSFTGRRSSKPLQTLVDEKLQEISPDYAEKNKKVIEYNKAMTDGYLTEGAVFTFNGAGFNFEGASTITKNKINYFLNTAQTIIDNAPISDMEMRITGKQLTPADQKTVSRVLNDGKLVRDEDNKLTWTYKSGDVSEAVSIQNIVIRQDISDGWVLDITIPEINWDDAGGSKELKDLDFAAVEIKLDGIQLEQLIKQTGLDLPSLELNQAERQTQDQLTKYGMAEKDDVMYTDEGPISMYKMVSHNDPENPSNIESTIDISGVSLDLEFHNTFEVATFQNALNSIINRAQHRLSLTETEIARTNMSENEYYNQVMNDEVFNFVRYVQETNELPLVTPEQAELIATEVVSKNFYTDSNNIKTGVKERKFTHTDGDTYRVNPNNMVNIADFGVPVQNSDFSLLKLDPMAIDGLKNITDNFPGLKVSNALRSVEDIEEMDAAGFHPSKTTMHLRGLGVDLVGGSSAQMEQIANIIIANPEVYGVNFIEVHDGNHLHIEFDAGMGGFGKNSIQNMGK